MEEGLKKPRGFRDEDYINKRVVFLRSYPLQWGKEEEEEKEEKYSEKEAVLLSLKSRLSAVFHWHREKVMALKRLKNKVGFYTVACYHFGFRSSTKLLAA